MLQYHIRPATDRDQKTVEDIFATAAAQFGLVDTRHGWTVQHGICNYSEGLGWGFGLGAIRIDDLICVGLNPAKSATERFRPVFDYIVGELMSAFGSRVALASKNQEINPATLPQVPRTEEHRAFVQSLLDRKRSDDLSPSEKLDKQAGGNSP